MLTSRPHMKAVRAAGVHLWVQLTCVLQEEDERDDPGQNHMSRPHHKARPEHIFEHLPVLAAYQRFHPDPAVRTHAHARRWRRVKVGLSEAVEAGPWSGAAAGRTAAPSASVAAVGRQAAGKNQLKIGTENRSVMVSLATVVKARICQQDSATVSREGQLQRRQKESRV